MEKPDPKELLEEALRTRKITIPPPYPGYVGRVRLNYDVQITDFTEYFDAATVQDLDENIRRYLTVAQEGLRDLNEHLGNMLGVPELEFHIPKNTDDGCTTPKLEGFDIDNRVIVKLLRGKGIKYDYTGNAFFGNIRVPFNVSNRLDVKSRLSRGYEIDPDETCYDLNIYRYPVMLNTKNGVCPEIHKFSDLSYYVLLNELEPFTSDHLVQRLEDLRKVGQSDLERETQAVLDEERIVGKILICNWLETRGISQDSVKEWISSMNDETDIKNGLRQARVKGAEKVVDFYCGDSWTLNKLLKPF